MRLTACQPLRARARLVGAPLLTAMALWSVAATTLAAAGVAPDHVPPGPPASTLPEMPYGEMSHLMTMDDTASFGKVLFDRLEWARGDGRDAFAWDAQAWYGGDYNRLWLKTEGEAPTQAGGAQRAELLWNRIFARWWSAQTGVRHDFAQGQQRTWLAIGVEGLAPGFYEVEATAYAGDAGRTAARLRVQRDLLLSRRLVLRPELEADAYGKPDPARQLGSGLAELQLGLRLRCELRHEFAPYLGVSWVRRFGQTADLARARGEGSGEFRALLGILLWF